MITCIILAIKEINGNDGACVLVRELGILKMLENPKSTRSIVFWNFSESRNKPALYFIIQNANCLANRLQLPKLLNSHDLWFCLHLLAYQYDIFVIAGTKPRIYYYIPHIVDNYIHADAQRIISRSTYRKHLQRITVINYILLLIVNW